MTKVATTSSKVLFDGLYPTAFGKDVVRLAIIQSNAKLIKDTQQAAKTITENLAHVVTLGKQACSQEKKPNILLFHEFPLTGYFYGS